jgi:uncharacterized protein (TIGR01777 family)
MTTLITGATGLVGKRLLEQLQDPVSLVRSPARVRSGTAHRWDATSGAPPSEAFRDVQAVVHLAGDPVSEGRWSRAKKQSIRDSRVEGTRNLIAGLSQLENKPRVLISASAVGIYGDRGQELLDEESPVGSGFLPEVCVDWEAEAMKASGLGIRVVCLRIGIVLAKEGGALAKMATPFKLGVGGRLGSGRQWMSWIHLDDLVGLILHAIANEQLHGIVNAVAPEPVTNAEFSRALARSLHRPALLPTPRSALRMLFGEMSEIMLASQRVTPTRALDSGYSFRFPTLSKALASLYCSEMQAGKPSTKAMDSTAATAGGD